MYELRFQPTDRHNFKNMTDITFQESQPPLINRVIAFLRRLGTASENICVG